MGGYKTYGIAGVMILLGGLHSQGYIEDGLYQSLQGLLTGGGFAFLRMGVAKKK